MRSSGWPCAASRSSPSIAISATRRPTARRWTWGRSSSGSKPPPTVRVTVVGKPAPAFFAAALTELGVAAGRAVMVGDDIHSDVLGAQDAGIPGVLVRTGKFRPSDLEDDGAQPEHVLEDIGQLPALLESLGP